MNIVEKIKKAKDYILSLDSRKIDVAIILGTGLGSIVDDIKDKLVINYKNIPEFPVSTVAGHAGELIIGTISGKRVLAMNGRFHFYEGYPMEIVTFAVRVIKALGVGDIIITNAAGGMNPDFEAGDLMLIEDHINFMGTNPLIGKNYEELGPRFPDMSSAYNRELITLAEKSAEKLGYTIKKGVYTAVSGPTYETPAELKMLRLIGGDAVGMSTVPEVIVANHMSMRILGISCITDMAIADNLEPLDHRKVLETANKAKTKFISIVKSVIEKL
ncbi:purine-nucleoside phosphorylase [Clostridium sp.]|jgi:purine-nucleoside phosphorylase|uniref:purine-nucleoside phosphorylase n=1 Tax=Clostridium sp. TaxID=1506 RepID=UPI002589AC29|nr:purine-nucleoside phosphorylase [Clostridium sp.]MDF2503813.1 purine nucleoside phosphorylase inosine and guanosine-specific [Clostridium sp.]